jgi:hypothetical protein
MALRERNPYEGSDTLVDKVVEAAHEEGRHVEKKSVVNVVEAAAAHRSRHFYEVKETLVQVKVRCRKCNPQSCHDGDHDHDHGSPILRPAATWQSCRRTETPLATALYRDVLLSDCSWSRGLVAPTRRTLPSFPRRLHDS